MHTSAILLAVIGSALAFKPSSQRPHELVLHRDLRTNTCTLVSLQETQIHKRLRRQPVIFEEAAYDTRGVRVRDGRGHWERLRYVSYDLELLQERARDHCGTHHFVQDLDTPASTPFGPEGHVSLTYRQLARQEAPQLELHPLIQSGPSENRVDLTFFSDGYTKCEKEKFLEDAMRLALDVSSNQTFNTVKPLLNFWAAFVPSNESGIGVGGKPKDTVFGLYRDGTELRGVYYSDADKARLACSSLGDKCDYPILMGNDPLYGGLGGEFTVITPSLANGALVLRHELGHSIIDVGEEYDGGFAYFGINSAENITAPVSWMHWLTNTTVAAGGEPRVERSVMPLQDYAWTMLNTSAPWSTHFTSAGTYAWHLVRFSLSGIPGANDLRVELDGQDLGWVPRKDIGDDRWHYDVRIEKTLSAGSHEVSFFLKNEALAAPQLCNVEILEFGGASEFNRTPGNYGIYPTFSVENATSYRPTNEDCLMRIVTTPNFCRVCLEGLWLALLALVELIDAVEIGCVGNTRVLKAYLVPLGHLRDDDVLMEDAYTVRWFKDGEEMMGWENQTQVEVGQEEGLFEIDVGYHTKEVKVDKEGHLSSHVSVAVKGKCGV